MIEGAFDEKSTKTLTGENNLVYIPMVDKDNSLLLSKTKVDEWEPDNPKDSGVGSNGRFLYVDGKMYYYNINGPSRISDGVQIAQDKGYDVTTLLDRQILYLTPNPDFKQQLPNLVGQNINDVVGYNLSQQRYNQLNNKTSYDVETWKSNLTNYQQQLRIKSDYRSQIENYILRKIVPLNKYYDTGY